MCTVVPNEWAIFSASSPDFSPLHNHNYTLVCEVTPVPGMNLPITVNWILPNGDLVTEEDGIISTGTAITTTSVANNSSSSCGIAPGYIKMAFLPIIFNPITNSDGGYYYCRASVEIPWQSNQTSEISKKISISITSKPTDL